MSAPKSKGIARTPLTFGGAIFDRMKSYQVNQIEKKGNAIQSVERYSRITSGLLEYLAYPPMAGRIISTP
ncbi:hypothetical protein D9M69_619080 [compost metagenome]